MTSVEMLANLRPSDVIIAIMGATGTGKSTFINLLTNDKNVVIGHKIESQTSNVTVSRYDIDSGRSVFLVDTPGFDDSRENVTDTDILEKIVDFLQPKKGASRKLNGIIYMHRISDPRLGGVSKKNLKMFSKLCGNDQLHNVHIVTTFWSEVDKKKAVARETDLASTAFKPLIESGATLLRHDDTAKSALSIISELIIKKPVMMLIQQELNEGKKLADTSAGVVITEEIVRLRQKHEKEMASLIKEMEEAAEAKDEALRAELAEEHRELERKMARADGDRRRLEKTLHEARADLKVGAGRERLAMVEMEAMMKKAEMDRLDINRKAEEERKRHEEHLEHLRNAMKRADSGRADMQRTLEGAGEKEKAERARMMDRQTKQAAEGNKGNEEYLRETMEREAKDRTEMQKNVVAMREQGRADSARAAEKGREPQAKQAAERHILAGKAPEAEGNIRELEKKLAKDEPKKKKRLGKQADQGNMYPNEFGDTVGSCAKADGDTGPGVVAGSMVGLALALVVAWRTVFGK